jgi:hypothetical protein
MDWLAWAVPLRLREAVLGFWRDARVVLRDREERMRRVPASSRAAR